MGTGVLNERFPLHSCSDGNSKIRFYPHILGDSGDQLERGNLPVGDIDSKNKKNVPVALTPHHSIKN